MFLSKSTKKIPKTNFMKIRYYRAFPAPPSNQLLRAYVTSNQINFGSSTHRKKSTKQRVQTFLLALAPIICFGLGTWQVQRLRWKVGLIEEYSERIAQPPINLTKPLKSHDVIDDLVYRRVRVTGKFHHDQEILLGPRTHDHKPGYFVITPFERENGTTILVQRGWISSEKADPVNRPNAQITGTVTIEGLVKRSDKKNIFSPENKPEKNIWIWSDVEQLAAQSGAEPVLVEQTLEVSPLLANKFIEEGYPLGVYPQVNLRNTHTEYAITWYSLGLATSVMFYMLTRKLPSGQLQRQVLRG